MVQNHGIRSDRKTESHSRSDHDILSRRSLCWSRSSLRCNESVLLPSWRSSDSCDCRCFINIRRIGDRLFLFLWIVPYFLFTYLFGTLNYPRYYLPIIPGLMIPLVASPIQSQEDSQEPTAWTPTEIQSHSPIRLSNSINYKFLH